MSRNAPDPYTPPERTTMVAQRLEAGRIEYGDRSAREKTPFMVVGELYEEVADIGGWKQIFRDSCELRGIAIPPEIESALEGLDVASIGAWELLGVIGAWARKADR